MTLKNICDSYGIDKERLSKRTGIPYLMIAECWEDNEIITLKNAVKIAKALDMSLEALAGELEEA